MQFPVTFGPYQLLERIAVGGMAEVYLARSFGVEGFEKKLVIKKIIPDLAANPRFVSMFVHEAKLSVALNHPNVVQVFDLDKAGDDLYMAMEYIHGRDLTQVLRELRRTGQRMPMGLAARIAANVARGLAYAHARTAPDGRPLHIVHRDVSPHNIMIGFEGDVKLVDFGIARLVGETDSSATGRPGGGKFAYMSPEQAAGQPLDHRSDVFSLGVVLFEMLAGRRLFADGDPDEKLRAVVECIVPDVRIFNAEVPDGLVKVLERCLVRHPDGRYADAGAMEEDLRAWLFESGSRQDLGPWVRALFADSLQGDPGAADLERLAEDLHAMHTGVDPEPEPSHSNSDHSTHSQSDERSARSLPLGRGERKHVVVLVAEVNGLTEVSARAETEEIGRLHYRMLRMVRRLIDRMGGVAERFDDDTLFVFFGLPAAHGDDVDRALSCASEFHKLAQRLRRRGIAIEFSIGVHIGELNVSRRVGKHFRFTARGDTLKTCVRLAYAADPGSTLASDRVAALAGDRFAFDRGPEMRRKGTRGTRSSFVLGGLRRRGPRGPSGRWIRRADELEILRDAIASLREGRGERIAVRGGPGTGKTRFLRELRDLAQRRGIPIFHGRALPFGADRPLAAYRDLVNDILGIEGDTPPKEIRERLQRLAELYLDPNDIGIIATLYAMEFGERREPGREAIDRAMVKLIRGLASDRPTIVLIEDVQYMDPFELGLMEQLVRASEGEPVLLIASWRGEVAPLAGRMREIHLGALKPDHIAALAADLLGAESVGPDLTRLVQRTAEGNPLYLEEILKALQQNGRIWYEGATARLRDPQVDPGLPPTLQGLIAARVDALDPVSKGALQVAAVIGMSFSPALLGEAVGADEPMALLGELVRSGLVQPESRNPETAYAFASVLVWECVNRGILGVQRREYHKLVAGAMERLYRERMDPVIESFATHCHAGGRLVDAVNAIRAAGELLERQQYLERALDARLRGIAWLDEVPRAERDPVLEAWLHVEAGEVAVLLGLPVGERMLQIALDIASETGPTRCEARSLLALGQLYRAQGRMLLSRANLENAASLARRIKDPELHVRVLESLGALALDEVRLDEARSCFDEGLRVAGNDDLLAARMLLGLANHELQHDHNEEARRILHEALPRAERGGDRILLGRIANNLGIAVFNEGHFHEAITEFRRALEVRRGLGYRHGEVINLHNIGDAMLRLGDIARAYASFEQSHDLARSCGWDRAVVMNEVYLLYLRGLRGEEVSAELSRASAACLKLGDKETALIGRWFGARLLGDRDAIRAVQADADAAGLRGLSREIAASA